MALLAVMIGAWVSARAAIWDNPIANAEPPIMAGETALGRTDGRREASAQQAEIVQPAPQSLAYPPGYGPPGYGPPGYGAAQLPVGPAYGRYPYPTPIYYGYGPQYASGAAAGYGPTPQNPVPQIVYYPVYQGAPPFQGYHPAAGRVAAYPGNAIAPQQGRYARAPDLRFAEPRLGYGGYALDDISRFAGQDVRRTGQVSRPGAGSGLAAGDPPKTDRWFLDVFGFYRQGSGALSIPQGPVPIYGASQLAANLQWRAKPSSSHDPRIFLRAYQAQVEGGESEIAAGVSVRPSGKLPVRLYGELRATQSPAVSDLGLGVKTRLRPAFFAVSELAPVKLPMGFSLETYGAGGYVAGSPSTYFLDGQAVATRELLRIGKPGAGGAVSVGGGIWGGAQRDAKRLDVGPTLRFDVDIGKMPARVSVDYREQVAGDAEPDSGVAATVSTRF